MGLATKALESVCSGKELAERRRPEAVAPWSLANLAGRFVEIGGGPDTAGLSVTARLVLAAQWQGGLVAWISDQQSLFFPQDFAAAGVDVAALPLVKVENMREAARAADMLLRSGAFLLVVLDLDTERDFSLPMQTRLAGLAKAHHTALLRLTSAKRDTPRGSLVSLRVSTEKHREGHDFFACTVHARKDKYRNPGWKDTEFCHGTDGLC